MIGSEHLAQDRLAAARLTAAEQTHVDACFRCRSERRMAAVEGPAPPPESPYRLGRIVGSGGMGLVYEARHTLLGTRHAVKVLRVFEPVMAARLVREGRFQARLVHRNIVPVDDVVEIGGSPALVMPFVDGPTLAAVPGRETLPEPAALAVFHGVATGVAEIHRARLVHRDLKPSNVLLEVGGREIVPRVTDFGLVKTLAPRDASLQTASGAMLGTPAYAAPEQLLDAATVGPQADVFALGCLLYELLTGRRAFRSFDRSVPPDLSAVPERFRPLVRSALAFEVVDRPEDAQAVLELLPDPGQPADLARWCGPADGPAAASETLCPLDLPQERDVFVGREAEIDRLDELLAAGNRFVAVVGPGGIGKTRLCLRYGTIRGAAFAGGATWVDAAGEAPETAVARVLGLVLGTGSAVDQVGRALEARGPLLLLVDAASAPDAEATLRLWLARAPDLIVVAAARAPYGSEPTVLLDGLPTPEAARLFAVRAVAVRPGFEVTVEEQEQLGILCERLGGMPLAIELVAARLRVMSLDGVLARASDPLRLAGGGTGRHGAVRAVFDSVWDELGDDARQAFAQLALFADRFSVDGAEAVVDLGPDPLAWVPDLVQELCERAMLRSIETADGVRIRCHPLLREYGLARLAQEADRARRARARHAAHFARHLAAFPRLWQEDASARRSLADEAPDIFLATERMIADGEGKLAADLSVVSHAVYELRGPASAGLGLYDRLETVALAPADRIRVALGALSSLRVLALPRAVEVARSTRDAARALGDPTLVARSTLDLGVALREAGAAAEATEVLSELLSDRTDERIRITALRDLAYLDADAGRAEDALDKLRSVTVAARRIGDLRLEATAVGGMGFVHDDLGRFDDAITAYGRALALARALDDRRGEAVTLGNLGWTLFRAGRWSEAKKALDDGFTLHARTGSLRGQALLARNLAQLALRRSDPPAAARWTRIAIERARELGSAWLESNALLTAAEAALDRPDEARGYLDLALATRSSEDWVRVVRAEVELRAGEPRAALSWLDQVTDLGSGRAVMVEALRGLAHALLGARAEALGSLDRLDRLLELAPVMSPDGGCRLHLDRAEIAYRLGLPQRGDAAVTQARAVVQPLAASGIRVEPLRFAAVAGWAARARVRPGGDAPDDPPVSSTGHPS